LNLGLIIRIVFFLIFVFTNFNYVKANQKDEYLKMCRKYASYPDSLIKYGNLLISIDDSIAKGEGYFALGLANNRLLELDKAITNYNLALQYITITNDFNAFFRITQNIGVIYFKSGKLKEAEEIFIEMLKIGTDKNDSSKIAASYNQLGIIKQMEGDFETAITNFKNSLFFIGMAKPESVNSIVNIGILYGNINQDSISHSWFLKAYNLAKQFNIEDFVVRSANNLSASSRKLNRIDSSLHYAMIAYNLTSKSNNKMANTIACNNVAQSYIVANDLQAAEKYVDEALADFSVSKSSTFDYFPILSAKVEVLEKSDKLSEAMRYLDIAFSITDSVKYKERWLRLVSTKSRILEMLDKKDEALQELKKATILSKELQTKKDAETIQKVANEIHLNEKAKTNKDVVVSNTDQSRSTLFWVLAISMILFTVILFGYYRLFMLKKQFTKSQSEAIESNAFNNTNLGEIPITAILLKSKALLNYNEITHIIGEGHYLNIYTSQKLKPEIERDTLKSFLLRLPHHQFIQIHRSIIINVSFIKAIYSNRVLLSNGLELSMSRTYKSSLLKFKQ
jgi:tetratricopeptide (TPR) repeat protein